MGSGRAGLNLLAIGLIGMLLAACGDGASGDPVRFGEGRIPDSVPRGFPVPADAVIGATMVDTINHRTEFSINMESDLLSVIQFFTIELVNQGYVIDRSRGLSQTTWEIAFSREELAGTVLVTSDGGGLAQAVVSLNVS